VIVLEPTPFWDDLRCGGIPKEGVGGSRKPQPVMNADRCGSDDRSRKQDFRAIKAEKNMRTGHREDASSIISSGIQTDTVLPCPLSSVLFIEEIYAIS
jgi:hypothetical protein